MMMHIQHIQACGSGSIHWSIQPTTLGFNLWKKKPTSQVKKTCICFFPFVFTNKWNNFYLIFENYLPLTLL